VLAPHAKKGRKWYLSFVTILSEIWVFSLIMILHKTVTLQLILCGYVCGRFEYILICNPKEL